MKYLLTIFSLAVCFLMISPLADAHVVVKPNQVGVGAFQTFSVGVPNEKDIPVTMIRLIIPDGLNYVTPNVKPGWSIEIKKDGTGEDAKVSEIIWSKGSVPAGQRDEFVFSTQAPAKETTVQWKAYQTYQDGTIVSWDQKPGDEHAETESETAGPYSETKVVNDLTVSPTPVSGNSGKRDNLTFVISIAALAISVVALSNNRNKK